jgi:hypothetical protein
MYLAWPGPGSQLPVRGLLSAPGPERGPVFPLANSCVVGLTGLEPGTSSSDEPDAARGRRSPAGSKRPATRQPTASARPWRSSHQTDWSGPTSGVTSIYPGPWDSRHPRPWGGPMVEPLLLDRFMPDYDLAIVFLRVFRAPPERCFCDGRGLQPLRHSPVPGADRCSRTLPTPRRGGPTSRGGIAGALRAADVPTAGHALDRLDPTR